MAAESSSQCIFPDIQPPPVLHHRLTGSYTHSKLDTEKREINIKFQNLQTENIDGTRNATKKAI